MRVQRRVGAGMTRRCSKNDRRGQVRGCCVLGTWRLLWELADRVDSLVEWVAMVVVAVAVSVEFGFESEWRCWARCCVRW